MIILSAGAALGVMCGGLARQRKVPLLSLTKLVLVVHHLILTLHYNTYLMYTDLMALFNYYYTGI